MSNPFVGEIRIVGFSYAPRGFAACNGQLMSIAQNAALYAILGTTYGGDGQVTFGLPNMQARAPMNWGSGPGLTPRVVGETLGEAQVTLLPSNLPIHSHGLESATLSPANPAQNVAAPTAQAMLGLSSPGALYGSNPQPPVTMSPQIVGQSGNSNPHDNQQPLLALNFVIALEGIFPARN